MDLILEVRTGRERVTMACHGKLVGGKEAEAFRRSAILLMGGFEGITINLAGLRTLDCGGLGSLASVLAHARERGKRVRITHPSPRVKQLFRMMRMEQFFEESTIMPPIVMRRQREAVA